MVGEAWWTGEQTFAYNVHTKTTTGAHVLVNGVPLLHLHELLLVRARHEHLLVLVLLVLVLCVHECVRGHGYVRLRCNPTRSPRHAPTCTRTLRSLARRRSKYRSCSRFFSSAACIVHRQIGLVSRIDRSIEPNGQPHPPTSSIPNHHHHHHQKRTRFRLSMYLLCCFSSCAAACAAFARSPRSACMASYTPS